MECTLAVSAWHNNTLALICIKLHKIRCFSISFVRLLVCLSFSLCIFHLLFIIMFASFHAFAVFKVNILLYFKECLDMVFTSGQMLFLQTVWFSFFFPHSLPCKCGKTATWWKKGFFNRNRNRKVNIISSLCTLIDELTRINIYTTHIFFYRQNTWFARRY